MDFQLLLLDIFRNRTVDAIDNIIRIVQEDSDDPDDVKLEKMVNLLSYTGNLDMDSPSSSSNTVAFGDLQGGRELLDEAAGFNWNLINEITKDEKQATTLSRLIDILPDADPTYLSQKVKELGSSEDQLEAFITHAIEKNDYPTREEYLKRKNEETERQHYTTNFHLYEFLKEYPDPFATFENANRKHSLSKESNDNKDEELIEEEKEFALTFLFNTFRLIRKSNITRIFNAFKSDIVKTAYKLRKFPLSFKEPRPLISQDEDLKTNMLLLKEIAFIKNMDEIRRVIDVKKKNISKARELGILQCCKICYFDELVPEECYICSNECVFCRDCIKKGIEIAIAEEKLQVGCLYECGGDFSLTTLQMVLDRKTFAHFWQKKQLYEIEKAQIDGIEFCCLCYKFAYIPNPEDKIFHCTACNKESCRQCKHEAHVPLRCNEIEYDEDVKMRTYIEDKMTEALVRKCYKCGKQYIKSSGCNKMTCDCGGKMCYLCNIAIDDYSHFGQGRCPLFTDDNLIHIQNVRDGATKAKAELGVDKNPEILKFDPAKDL